MNLKPSFPNMPAIKLIGAIFIPIVFLTIMLAVVGYRITRFAH